MKNYIRIHPTDNVAVALQSIPPGEMVEGTMVVDPIPLGHKILLESLSAGADIIKYGAPIGHLLQDMSAGMCVDQRHIKTNLSGHIDYVYHELKAENKQLRTIAQEETLLPHSFKGFRRKNGEVGTRNDIWIIPTVGCVNGTAQQLAKVFQSECDAAKDSLEKDAESMEIIAYGHNYGCSQLGDDHENTRKILRNMALHPNAGAVLIIGLGCENNTPDSFKSFLGDYDTERIRFMITQEEEDEMECGMAILRELYTIAKEDRRTDIPLSELRIGLKCGGSDGLSGITANPLLGAFSDFLVAQGGTTVLTEVPEMFGAETLLMDRCETRDLFDKTVSLINDFKDYFTSNNQPIYENPSPGNKAGGISTLEEKSLGCTQKAGTSLVKDVLKYGDKLKTKGLNLLSSPGNDLVASTALASTGCQLVLFTTGRGTPFGTFVPTAKISTNTALYKKKRNWIDFNAGTLVEDSMSMEQLLKDFVLFIIETASGKPTHNEQNLYRDFAIFKTGVTL